MHATSHSVNKPKMMKMPLIEPLESRIAPAAIVNPIFDIAAGVGQKGASIDLGTLVDATKSYRTVVEMVTNFTPAGASSPAVIAMELFDDKAPVTVSNFLRYLNNKDTAADYDGGFFHRLVQGFVLQGGGFNATNTFTHIETFTTVHNEFDPADSERSNLVQTVAMAKVGPDQGGGPHSATSEFFINLADNAGNLDAQNGGFTVFGRVTDASMPFVNAIAALQTAGNFPVQNYSGGTPTAAQLIQFVDMRVVPATPGNTDGHTFSVVVTDAATDQPTKLVKATINASTGKLDLAFSSTLNGTAKVKVTAGKNGMEMTDEFLVNVKPNLIGEFADDGLPATFVPGDNGTAKLRISNNSGGLAKGTVNVKLFLSESNFSNNSDANGFALDPMTDLQVAAFTDLRIKINPGKSATLPLKFTIPSDGLVDGKKYRMLALVETPAGSTIQELFSDDNTANFRRDDAGLGDPEVLRTFDFAFGTVGGRANVPITVKDANGDDVTFTLKGPGTGTLTFGGGETDISITGSDPSSKLLAKTARGVIADVDDIFINQTIGTVKLGNVHLHGHFTASGGAKSIVFGDLGNTDAMHPENNADHTISIGAFPSAGQKLTTKFASVRDYSLATDMEIASLTADEWLNDAANTAANTITSPAISSLKIGASLQASVLINGTAKLNLLSVGGTLGGATVRTSGEIGSIKLGDIAGSSIFAGVLSKPTVLGDLATGTKIGSFIVSGTMSDSTVAAGTINSVSVSAVDADAGSTKGGFYADAIKSYVRKGVVTLKNLDSAAKADSVDPNYEVQIF